MKLQKASVGIFLMCLLGCNSSEQMITIDSEWPLLPALPPNYQCATNVIYPLIYSYLALVSPTGELEPDLADHWSYDAGQLLWRIHLRRAYWHDGSPVTPEEVAFCILRYSRVNSGIKIDTIMPWNPNQVLIKLRAPDPWLMHRLGAMEIVPVDQAVWKGSGPFRVEERDSTDIILRANPLWYGAAPKIQRIRMQYVSDRKHSLERIEAGDTDVVFNVDSAYCPTGNVQSVSSLSEYYTAVIFRGAMLENQPLRSVVATAINVDKILETMHAKSVKKVMNVVGFESPYAEKTADKSDTMPIERVEDFPSINLCAREHKEAAEGIRQDLLHVGVDAKIIPMDTFDAIDDCDGIITGIRGAYGPNPDDWINYWLPKKAKADGQSKLDEDLQKLRVLIDVADDADVRADFIRAADRKLLQAHVLLPIAQLVSTHLSSMRLSEPVDFNQYGIRQLARISIRERAN